MPAWIERVLWSIAKLTLLSPYYFVVGSVELVKTLLRVLGRGTRQLLLLPAGMRDTITCPHGHENDARGRFECADCKSIYLGWVGKCPVCGAGASYIACDTCGCAIALPWDNGK